jgi:hypothetical protein
MTPEVEDTFYIRRLDGGLFTLQTVDYILAWLIMEDDGVSPGQSIDSSFYLHSILDKHPFFTNVGSWKSKPA